MTSKAPHFQCTIDRTRPVTGSWNQTFNWQGNRPGRTKEGAIPYFTEREMTFPIPHWQGKLGVWPRPCCFIIPGLAFNNNWNHFGLNDYFCNLGSGRVAISGLAVYFGKFTCCLWASVPDHEVRGQGQVIPKIQLEKLQSGNCFEGWEGSQRRITTVTPESLGGDHKVKP